MFAKVKWKWRLWFEQNKGLNKWFINKTDNNRKEAKAINPFKILEFTKSNIWQEVRNAKEVYKEKPFILIYLQGKYMAKI